MRVSISPRGSLIDMDSLSLPARLDHAGYLAGRGEFAQRDARQLELAVIGARTPRHRTAVADARRRRVARQLGKLELRGKTVFRRRVAIGRQRLQPGAARRLLLRQLGA